MACVALSQGSGGDLAHTYCRRSDRFYRIRGLTLGHDLRHRRYTPRKASTSLGGSAGSGARPDAEQT
jgi:hypothetical protein